MAKSTVFNIRMDPDVRKESDVLFRELGLSLSTAINIFLKKAIREGGFPFDLRLDAPSQEVEAALAAAAGDDDLSDPDELLDALDE